MNNKKYGFILNVYGIQSTRNLSFIYSEDIYEGLSTGLSDETPTPGWVNTAFDTDIRESDKVSNTHYGLLVDTEAEAQRFREGVNLLQRNLQDFLLGFTTNQTDPLVLAGIEEYKRILMHSLSTNT